MKTFAIQITICQKDKVIYKYPAVKDINLEDAKKILLKLKTAATDKFITGSIKSLNLIYDGFEFTNEVTGSYDRETVRTSVQLEEQNQYSFEFSQLLGWLNDPKTLSN